jgi:dipeptidyl aminopeptidase/acylaminoacyl peptidase
MDEVTTAAASSTVETVRLLSQVGSCGSPSFSPDGSRIAFVSDISGIPQIWTVDSGGGWPDQLTALEDPVYTVSWSPVSDWLAFLFAPAGGNNTQIGAVRADGTGMMLVTDGGEESNMLGGWTPDGSRLMVASNRRLPDAIDAYLVDPATRDFQFVAAGQAVCSLTDVSPDGRLALLQRDENRVPGNVYVVDLEHGAETLLTPHEGLGTFAHASFAADGRSVLLASDAGSELTVLASVELGTETPVLQTILRREDAELEHFSLSPDRQRAFLGWNVGGRSEIELLELPDLTVTATPHLPAEFVQAGAWGGDRWGIAWSGDSRRVAFGLAGSTSPPDVWCLERELTQVTHSPHPGVALSELVAPELVRFSAHDGLELSGWLYPARGASGPGPTVVSFHGGPEGMERPVWTPLYQALLQRGIAVFAPNIRGSGGFGKTFVNLDNGALRYNAIRDIEACVHAAVDSGVAASGRIGIMGASFGGYMTMAGLAWYSDLFAAGANSFGVVNFATFFAHTQPWMAAISKIEYGDPDTEADLLHDLSPLTHIDRVVAPTLILHGANDTNVPVIEAEQVVASLFARGIPHEYLLFPDEGHGFVKAHNRVTANAAIVGWFDRYL